MLHIDEYKVFKNFDIDFTDKEGKAQNLIVLAGVNGTGKTTLLKFILKSLETRYMSYPGKKKGDSYIDFFHNIESFQFTPTSSSSFFIIDENTTRILLDERILVDERPSNKSNSSIHFFKVKSYEYDGYNIENDDDYIDYSNSEVGIIKAYIDKYIYDDQLRSHEVYAKLSVFVNSIFSDFSLGFKFSRYSADGLLYFKTIQNIEVTLEDLSTGERQLLNFALRLFVADIHDSIILIDEPEFSLHPSWQNKIVGVLQRYADAYNCQVILATHSPHIIGSVHSEQLRLLYKDENGAIKVVETAPNAYGMTFDRVLSEVMGVENLRTPKVEEQLKELHELVKKNQYNSDIFISKMKDMENTIGYSDRDLILMRFEVAKRKKESAATK